jgi:Trk K+ transport system NAD-binding subunit
MLKTLSVQLLSAVRSRRGQRNLQVVLRFFLILLGLIVLYSLLFDVLMEREGQTHTWVTGFYWTLTVMSTLGFGDITFNSDIGRIFSIVVLLSGILFLLILFPFIFIEFFYEPLIQVQTAARAPRELPPKLRDHVLITNYDAVTAALVRRLDQHQVPYALLVPELDEALRLHDTGLNVVVGELDDPEAWRRVGVERAALVVATNNDFTNTNIAFTVRGLSEDTPIITTASDEDSVDVLSLAGSSQVIQLEEMIGNAFARRAVGGDALSHEIGRFDHLVIAEANARRTPLVGKTLRQSNLRENLGVSVVGVWGRGSFQPPHPDATIHEHTILVLAGLAPNLQRYDEIYCIYNVSVAPAVILGGGRVGRATARALAAREIDYLIVEPQPELAHDPAKYIIGNAADLEVLKKRA